MSTSIYTALLNGYAAAQTLTNTNVMQKVIMLSGIGIVGGSLCYATKYLMPEQTSEFKMLNAIGNKTIAKDHVVTNICQQLQPYSIYGQHHFKTIVVNFTELVDISQKLNSGEMKARVSLLRMVSKKISAIIEAVRKLRSVVQQERNPVILHEFDEIAMAIQNTTNDMGYNLTKAIEYNLVK